MTPVVAAQMAYGDLVEQFPAGRVFAECSTFRRLKAEWCFNPTLSTVLPMIDLMLGGAGSPAETPRPLTEIEQEIFKPVIELFGGQLQALWGPVLETSLRFEHHGAAAGLFPANERVYWSSLRFTSGNCRDVDLNSAVGRLQCLYPKSNSNCRGPEVMYPSKTRCASKKNCWTAVSVWNCICLRPLFPCGSWPI